MGWPAAQSKISKNPHQDYRSGLLPYQLLQFLLQDTGLGRNTGCPDKQLTSSVSSSIQEEREADESARDILIPQADWLASGLTVEPTMEAAMALADKLRIHPAIVAGRVGHETGNWRLLSSIKADVRRLFADQLQALAQPA